MPRYDQAAEPLKVHVFPQDPEVTPDPVPIHVGGTLLAGPVGTRVAVYDFNRDRDEVYRPADPEDGEFPNYDTGDFRFHQLNCYGIVARAVEFTERELGHDVVWPFEASRLIVLRKSRASASTARASRAQADPTKEYICAVTPEFATASAISRASAMLPASGLSR